MSIKERIEQHLSNLTEHQLVVVADTPEVLHLRLQRGESRMGSVDLIELRTTRQTVISGDYCPGDSGVLSTNGYGLKWLARASTSPGYLAEKFRVPSRSVPEDAASTIEKWLEDREGWCVPDSDVESLQDLVRDLRSGSHDHDTQGVLLYEELSGLDGDYVDDGGPGWERDPSVMAPLVAIARTLARLWKDGGASCT